MFNRRPIYFILLILFGGVISFLAIKSKANVELPATLSPAFQLLGKPVKTLDRSLTKLMPISDLDEKKLGDSIALRYESYADEKDPDLIYLRSLISNLTIGKEKRFEYRIFIMDSSVPNAYAMPGGVLFVTKGLLNMVTSEAELVAVLGHEIGHVELSHCMDMVRGELLARKIGASTLGELADLTAAILLRPAFGKNQEDESDQYGYDLLLRENYDPFAMGRTFLKLQEESGGKENAASPIQEYFMTHPYLSHRSEKFSEKARMEEEGKYYLGKKNLKKRTSRYQNEYDQEFITH
ncbi:M48 family metallopeptidase [Leptospira sarikeiensis]|uniref:Peptidase M48 n=1 Tax=Leptospira sarikeiensis TaxID=2484943 RepID=A0A4V6QM69_9LEPT|nr:M48 family metallopeptidase [Leptospira sarikeiensis]TGL60992.1 peptidase M48 [Leptospira sarikeiensis]